MQKEKGVSILVGVIIIIAVALVAFGGVFAYQYFVKSQTSNPNDQQNPNAQNQNQQKLQTDIDTSSSSKIQTIKDCGISKSNKTDFEKDATLVCLGQNIADNCTSAKAILIGVNNDEELIEINGKDFDNCIIKETITKDLNYPLYVNKYMECPVDKLLLFGSGKNITQTEILKNPGNYMGGLVATMSLFFLNTKQAIGELGCITNFDSASLK